jgi:hypothetical protein
MASLTPRPAAAPVDPSPDAPAPDEAVAPPRTRLPPAAAAGGGVPSLFALTLLSAADGSLLALAAAGRLSTLGGALTVGLLVVAGAGSWLAARQAFAGRRPDARGWRALGLLGVLTLASTVASAWLGSALGEAVTLHALPKAAGVVLLLLSAEMAGVRMPRPGRVPLPVAALAAGFALEALLWTA